MKIKKLLQSITYQKVMAVIFLAFIFVVGTVNLPSVAVHAATYLRDKPYSALTVKDTIDEEYKNMLTFSGGILRNKGDYIDLNGAMARLMGQRGINERVKLDNGHLVTLINPIDVTPAVTQLTALYEKQAERGKAFLFIMSPTQMPKYEDMLPAGYTDYSNQNGDILLAELAQNGVPTLDLREAMQADGIDHTQAFFATDHHWTPQTGFWAYTKIIERLQQDGHMPIVNSRYTDIGQFDTDIYEDWFLGTAGKRTGQYYAGVDDFAIIKPKFDTYLTVDIPSAYIAKEGSFAHIAYNMDAFKLDYYQSNPYGIYGHGDSALTDYRNAAAPVDMKIMTIGDSLTNVTFTFLPLVFTTCQELDMRYYTDDFAAYYDEYDPDIMLVLIHAGTPVQMNTTYDFFGE